MKLTILVKRFKDENGSPLVDFPKIIKKGDWIDLRAAERMQIIAPQAGTLKGKNAGKRDVTNEPVYIPLGVAMQLPKGFEAIVVSRSSTPKKLGIISANNVGVIDNTYNGDDDQWKFPALSIRRTVIEKNTRICQFRIQLSQKATLLQKLKWLLSSGIEFKEVATLDNSNRGGLGTTGNK
jgi:dUTP pyrophosphatase